MRRWGSIGLTLLVAVVGLDFASTEPATAAANPPRVVVSAFPMFEGRGYLLEFADGDVVVVGPTVDYGPLTPSWPLAAPIIGGAGNGMGHWMLAADGTLFSFGHAGLYGSMHGKHLNQPVVSMAPSVTPFGLGPGQGYWLVARDGGVFAFGKAGYFGSTGAMKLNQPIVGMTLGPPYARGYRLVARDGGIFSFGDASFHGSLPSLGLHVTDVIGMAPTSSGRGYWIVRRGGQVYAFGDAQSLGSWNVPRCDPIAAIFAIPFGRGYLLATESGATRPFGSSRFPQKRLGTPRACPPPSPSTTAPSP